MVGTCHTLIYKIDCYVSYVPFMAIVLKIVLLEVVELIFLAVYLTLGIELEFRGKGEEVEKFLGERCFRSGSGSHPQRALEG